MNVTLNGWQDIYDKNGTLKEIRTIELYFPQEKQKSIKIQQHVSSESFAELYDLFKAMTKIGLPTQLSLDKYFKNGNLEKIGIVDEKFVYIFYENMAILNRTIYSWTETELKEYIEKKQKENLQFGIITHDSNTRQFLENESKILPHILVKYN